MWRPARPPAVAVLLALLVVPGLAAAQVGDLPFLTSTPGPGGTQSYSLAVQTLLLLTALTFLPAVLLLMTGFTRVVIVLSLLRHALGTQASPPNQVLVGLALFLKLARQPPPKVKDDIPLRVLVPAFVTSELKTAFQIGFLIFIPFLVIDIVVASVLMSLGMMMLSPVLVALPFKLMLFVLADGWNLLIGSLAASFVP